MTREWAVVVAVLAAVLGASLLPAPPDGGTLPLATAGHLLGYGALAGALALAMDGARWPLATAFALAVLVGAGVEVVQPAVGRDASLVDAATNAVGAAVAVAALRAR